MGSLDEFQPLSPLNLVEFRRQGHMIIDYIADYYQNIEKYPVRSQVELGYLKPRTPDSAPNEPEPFEKILEDITNHIIPGLTHWQSPNHFALFNCTTSNAAFLGEVLSTGFNIVGLNWISSPAATELEMIVMDWFGKMLNLPSSFLFSGGSGSGGGGTLQGTTCEATLSTLTTARDQMLRKIGRENIGKLVVYVSDQTHFSLQKAAKIAGISPSNVRVIPTTKTTQFALSPDFLRAAIIVDVHAGLVPLYLCASVGTTQTTAVDSLEPLCEITKEYGIWVHVDAAYAGSACICPEFRHFLNGIEGVDSFSLNAHKWFFSALDCCCLWVKDPTALIKALSTKPELLRNWATDSNQAVDYKDWQITLSRRFRALKLWIVLRSYGVVNLQRFIRKHVQMAKHFETLVGMDKRFEIVVPTNFALVCFRLSPKALHGILKTSSEEHMNEINRKLLESLNASGHVYMTHGMIGGMYFLRFAVGSSLTDYRHVEMAWKLIQEHADASLCSLSIS